MQGKAVGLSGKAELSMYALCIDTGESMSNVVMDVTPNMILSSEAI